ncbi:MAG: PhnD/SsuA/transferrin family substrate-binding protein [Notoacmeibacter sp.]|nr:PhnD/SsuA/transferrin family substrate-binding protein [Notoacmeibacter sp.]
MTGIRRIATAWLAGAALSLQLPGPALADWRADIGTFRIGVVSPDGQRAVPGMELVRDAFSKALGMPVEVFVARDFPALVDAQASGRIEYAVYSALAYAAAARLCDCVEPIAAPVGQDGATGTRSILVLRQGLPAGVVPQVAIAAAQTDLAGPAAFLATGPGVPEIRRRIVENMEAAEALFVSGEVDGIIGWLATGPDGDQERSGTAARLESLGRQPSAHTIAWRGPVLAYGPHTVRRSLDPQARKALAGLLAGMAATKPDVLEALSPLHPGGFRAVGPIDYATASEALEAVLKTE